MKSKQKPILVLGANGFIGSHLVDALVEGGYFVRAFDRFSANTERIFRSSDMVEIVSGDFLNQADLKKALAGIEIVFHLISTTNPATAEDDPLIDIDTNLHGSVALLQLCASVGNIRRVIYLSSGGTVYGNSQAKAGFSEESPTKPVSPYGIVKLAIEHYLEYFKVKHGLDYTVFRLSNPYGERQPIWRRQGVIPIFLDKIIKAQPISIYGDGSMVRDYIYVKDAVEMMVATLKVTPQYAVYNIGSGSGASVNEIVSAIESTVGRKALKEYLLTPSTFVHTSVLNTSRYETEFHMMPQTDISKGIELTYKYYRGLITADS